VNIENVMRRIIMKNKILNKKAGRIIIAGMLCAMLTAGCANSDSNTGNNAENKEAPTQAVTEAVTEATTEATTKARLKEPATIKIPSFEKNAGLGITAECTNGDYRYLNVSTLKDREIAYELTDECIKDTFYISIGCIDYSDVVEPDEKIKVSIPYEEGVYIVHVEDGVGYDVKAEYIDGKYVFETDSLGSFVIRTKPVGRTSPTKTAFFTLEEQTLVDEITGIQVTGKLPAGAKIETSMYIIDDEVIMNDRWNPPYPIEGDYPEYSNVVEHYIVDEYEKKVENIAKIINKRDWAQLEPYFGGKLAIDIYFIKDYEILDFESDLTVTLPFNYRRGLATGGIKDEAIAVQYDYDKREFINLEVLSAEATAKGMFQFKTKSTGCFFVGGKVDINHLVTYYKNQG
jgi:hypothetical protein